MALIKRKWTVKEVNNWTKEDAIACILSSIAYIALMVGTAMSLLALWQGYVILIGGVVLALLMYLVIDPKLKATSREYEKKQQQYLDDLEKTIKWEE